MAEHDNCLSARLTRILRLKGASQCRFDAEDAKVFSGHELAVRRASIDPRDELFARGEHLREHAIVVFQLLVFGARETVEPAVLCAPGEPVEGIGIAHLEGTQNVRVEQGEDSGIGAQA